MTRSERDERGGRTLGRCHRVAGRAVNKREVYKFFSGFLAGAGVVHANIGFAIAAGMFNEPRYLGRTWSAGSLWMGASVYLVASVALGYLGWRTSKPVPDDREKCRT